MLQLDYPCIQPPFYHLSHLVNNRFSWLRGLWQFCDAKRNHEWRWLTPIDKSTGALIDDNGALFQLLWPVEKMSLWTFNRGEADVLSDRMQIVN